MSIVERDSLKTNGAHPARPRDFIWRLSVEQYHQMIQNEILTDNDAVELLEGWLVQKMPKKPAHRIITRRLRKAVESLLPAGWFVDSQEPITLSDSEPEPDLSVVRGDEESFLEHHPHASDIGLLVEVSDTTLPRDRGVKKRVYARAGIPIYWIADIAGEKIEVYSEPAGQGPRAGYRKPRTYKTGDEVPLVLDGIKVGRISVRQIFAP